MQTLNLLLFMVMTMLSALLPMAFYTLAERKFLGYSQYRKGPNKPSLTGLMVPMSDAAKLFTKGDSGGFLMNFSMFNLAPLLMMTLSLILWNLYPLSYSACTTNFSMFFFLCVTSMGIYATFLAGWSSTSKWGLLGAIRGIAQTISYEVSMALIIICLLMFYGSMSSMNMFSNQLSWNLLLMIPLLIMWLMSIIAETHRAPLDFAEGESELVSGFNIEYKAAPFALIFMAEYMNILLMSMLTVMIMSSNMNSMDFILKICTISFLFIWFRTTFPRLRYDILMETLWKKMLPLSLSIIIMMNLLMFLIY